jgi:transposase
MEYKRISVDTSKAVFTLHGIDAQDRPTLSGDYSRSRFEAFFRKLAPTEVAMEACGGAYHWARMLTGWGHRVRLIPPQYVKPFVRRGKNDRNDARAINEAAARPDMASVPIKSAEQQADAMVLSARELLVAQRTQLVNAIRGHAAEFGLIAARGISRIDGLLQAIAANEAIPKAARDTLAFLAARVAELDERIDALEADMQRKHKANPTSVRLAAVPGIGPITALSLTLGVDPHQFKSGRHFAAWLGLTPKEHSTGGRPRLGGISKMGNERLRRLLVVGAMAVIKYAAPGSRQATAWLLNLLERKPRKLVAVALANKMARIAWAMMTSGDSFRRIPVQA